MDIDWEEIETRATNKPKQNKGTSSLGIDWGEVEQKSIDREDSAYQQEEARTIGDAISNWFSRRFSDLGTQTMLGLVKGGDTAINAIESVPPALSVANDPMRAIDYFAVPWNYFIDTLQNVGEAAFATPGYDVDMDLSGMKIQDKYGTYPETDSILYKKRQEDREKRKEFIDSFTKQYKDKYGADPALANILQYAPDLLIATAGGALDTPKMAALTEGLLSRGRALSEGAEDPDKVALQSALGGYLGTKIIGGFMNRLTPEELRVLNSRAASKEGIDDTVTLLQYMRQNPDFSYRTAVKAKTGNPTIDAIIERQRQSMSDEAYKKYMESLQSINEKGMQSIEELSQVFSKDADELYRSMKSDADKAWDKVAKLQDNTQVLSTDNLIEQLDEVLDKYGKENEPVKNFVRKMFSDDSYKMAIQDIDNQIQMLRADTAASRGVYPKEEFLARKAKNDAEIRELLNQKDLYKGMAAKEAREITPTKLVDRIKSLNDKAYLSGGNINTKSRPQMTMINDVRNTLMRQLDEFDNITDFKDAYDTARRKSRGIYELFGYQGGKNAGSKVFAPELGQVLEELGPQQTKIIEGLLNESPSTFVSKMKYFEDKLSPATNEKLKRAYIQNKLSLDAVNPGTLNTPAHLDTTRALTRLDDVLNTADGRRMVEELYGKETLDNLIVTRELTRALAEASKEGVIPERTMLQYLKELPGTIVSILGQRIRDRWYVNRQLSAYKDVIEKGYKAPDIITKNPAWNK